jgi:antibiotic biosynthesis monooxygenase (ABM) superfamily enzyme
MLTVIHFIFEQKFKNMDDIIAWLQSQTKDYTQGVNLFESITKIKCLPGISEWEIPLLIQKNWSTHSKNLPAYR